MQDDWKLLKNFSWGRGGPPTTISLIVICVGFKAGFIETSITLAQNIVSVCVESTEDDEIMTNVFWVSSLLSSVYMPFITSNKGGGTCFCSCLFVCLSVSRTRAWIWMKCCISTDVGTWMNWLTFEPDLDYSPDARTGLLSQISEIVGGKCALPSEF